MYFLFTNFIFLLSFGSSVYGLDENIEMGAKIAAEAEAAKGATKEKVTSFLSLLNQNEQCVALAKIPQGDYSKKDLEQENIFCALNFSHSSFALCPKTWSTSPATMIYDLDGTDYSQSTYESSQYCGQKKKASGVKTLAKFKNTMNASGTSGTLSQSSLLYYHFSRYFDSQVYVPVAVYREIDGKSHLKRVGERAISITRGKGMIGKGWRHLVNALSNPSSYRPTSDLFTADQKRIYGVLLRGKGERYGTEFNGTRASGWGKGQNYDFQKTPAFLALRQDADLVTAIELGYEKASRDSKMNRDLKGLVGLQGQAQMALWMRELLEISLMDYIFSQQDRVGNIDYRWYWAYVDGDKVKYKREKRNEYEELSRRQMATIPVPEKLASYNPILLQITQLNDNDAGGRIAYANFSKTTGMLENLRHYSVKLYKKLMLLDQDLQSKGPIYHWLLKSIDLSERRINQVVSNTHKAANLIRKQCASLRFDLDDVDNYLLHGAREQAVDCSLPVSQW